MKPLRFAPLWWSIGGVLVAVVATFSLLPPGDGVALLPDKLVHFTAYFMLGTWFVALAAQHPLHALAGVILLGGAIELLQGLTPERQPEWLDFLANALGATLALLVIRALPLNPFRWFESRVLKAVP